MNDYLKRNWNEVFTIGYIELSYIGRCVVEMPMKDHGKEAQFHIISEDQSFHSNIALLYPAYINREDIKNDYLNDIQKRELNEWFKKYAVSKVHSNYQSAIIAFNEISNNGFDDFEILINPLNIPQPDYTIL